MILVTVGTRNEPFDRLVSAADGLAVGIDEKVIIQRGVSHYEPQHAEHFRFVGHAEMEKLIREARVVVTHAGAGTILSVLLQGKPLVVVPRRRRFSEAKDDHQLDLSYAVAARGYAAIVLDPSQDILVLAASGKAMHVVAHDSGGSLRRFLSGLLMEWEQAGEGSVR